MSVVQINLWTCDLCGATKALSEPADSYSDPVVVPPPEWSTEFPVPENYRSHPALHVCDACPTCRAFPNWANYRESRP